MANATKYETKFSQPTINVHATLKGHHTMNVNARIAQDFVNQIECDAAICVPITQQIFDEMTNRWICLHPKNKRDLFWLKFFCGAV